jgi:hypothetical protein
MENIIVSKAARDFFGLREAKARRSSATSSGERQSRTEKDPLRRRKNIWN